MTGHEYCYRCKRPAPDLASSEYVGWEAALDDHDECVGIMCPGCLTGEEPGSKGPR